MKTLIKMIRITIAVVAFLCTQYANSQTYHFTNANAQGRTGPEQDQLNIAYANTNLAQKVISNSGIQSWTIPVTGSYTITAVGARGAGNGGYGTKMEGVFSLLKGEVIQIAVGQKGEEGTGAAYNGGGGGGGSFVILNADSILLIAAGGGGGLDTLQGGNASVLTAGGSTIWDGAGDNGNGGHSGITNGDAAGGGGFYTNGQNSLNMAQNICEGGKAFLNGARGGESGNCGNYYGGAGGFGGGGSGWHNGINRCGGGGGYSGGQGGTLSGSITGGGGGSINKGTAQNNSEGWGNDNGSVTIKFQNEIATNIAAEKMNGTALSIYPNPTDGTFAVSSKKISETNYKILTGDGKIVKQGKLSEENAGFDISELSNGTYYLEFEGCNIQKLVKTN
jgi:hypothetical protein